MADPNASGRVYQVNVSRGGVPKRPIEVGRVGWWGIEGDGHDDRTFHGGPHMALCLFPLEAIERLQAEGHPVEPGGVGENLTTTGVEWSTLPIGTRALIGVELEIEISGDAGPCRTIKGNFNDGRFSRLSIADHPSDSRMYARVLHPGEVRPGDEIKVQLPAPDGRARDELWLEQLDRAEMKSAVAAWQAARNAGYDVRIVEDGEIAMAATPLVEGPAFNKASGLARMPQLLDLVTDFYDQQQSPGWLVAQTAPWPGAKPGLELGVYAAEAAAVSDSPVPDGVHLRLALPTEGELVADIYTAVESSGAAGDQAQAIWTAAYRALAEHPKRATIVAELDGRPVAVASLHMHRQTGWLRAAVVLPEARGRGLQRALIAARVRVALERGCDLVGASAEPTGISARNLERLGMRQIGTRTHYQYTPGLKHS